MPPLCRLFVPRRIDKRDVELLHDSELSERARLPLEGKAAVDAQPDDRMPVLRTGLEDVAYVPEFLGAAADEVQRGETRGRRDGLCGDRVVRPPQAFRRIAPAIRAGGEAGREDVVERRQGGDAPEERGVREPIIVVDRQLPDVGVQRRGAERAGDGCPERGEERPVVVGLDPEDDAQSLRGMVLDLELSGRSEQRPKRRASISGGRRSMGRTKLKRTSAV